MIVHIKIHSGSYYFDFQLDYVIQNIQTTIQAYTVLWYATWENSCLIETDGFYSPFGKEFRIMIFNCGYTSNFIASIDYSTNHKRNLNKYVSTVRVLITISTSLVNTRYLSTELPNNTSTRVQY